MNKKSIITRFYLYQKSRFPILIIGLSLLPAILSSGAVVSNTISALQVYASLAISLLYLLHIRILDDRRDFNHDSLYHRSRPVQKGIITNKELWKIDLIIIPILILLAASFGILPLFIITIMLFYSFLAEKNFFIEKVLKKHFFIYNFINTIQTFILQLFVYIIFVGTIPLTLLVALHYMFTCVGTTIFEFVRKVKIPGEDGAGKDTYTWHLGFKKALVVYVFLVLIDLILFLRIISSISNNASIWLLFCTIALTIIVGLSYIHISKKGHATERFAQMTFVLIYAASNLIIYFSKLC